MRLAPNANKARSASVNLSEISRVLIRPHRVLRDLLPAFEPYYIRVFDKLCHFDKGDGVDFADMVTEERRRATELSASNLTLLGNWDGIEPSVALLRKELGEPCVPFDSYPEAIRWLEREAKKEQRPTEAAKRQYRSQAKKWNEVVRRLGFKPRSPEVLLIRYLKPVGSSREKEARRLEDWESTVPVSADSKLGRLAEGINAMAKGTGFSEASLTAYVLAGIKPVLYPVRVTHTDIDAILPDGTMASRFAIQIEIRSPHLSSRFFGRKLQRWVKESWNQFLPLPDSFDTQLTRVVDDLGGRPTTKYSKHFWASVYERCENEGLINQPDLPAYEDFYSLATRYYRRRGDR